MTRTRGTAPPHGVTCQDDRIVSRPDVCGAPVIRGTRIGVKVILDNLADGLMPEEIVAAYAGLTVEDVQAVIARPPRWNQAACWG